MTAALCVLWSMCAPFAHADASLQRGFVATGWNAGSYLTARSDRNLRRMAADGSTDAAIFTQWFMDTPSSSQLAPDPARTPSDAAIAHAIATARESGMQAVLKPQIGIRTGDWIGYAHPADLAAFWASYRAMLLHYADLAQRDGASMLVIGTEMRTLSGDDAQWRALIAQLREHFSGALTYAANFDEFERIGFWDALDYVGIDAYFGLADPTDPAPPVAQLAAAWSARGYLARIAAVSARTGRRVVFTEVGYRAMRTTAVAPNLWNAVGATDPQAQANAYQALYDAVAGQPWLAGIYWWAVDMDSWWVQDYSPLGKPAEQVMTAWNRGGGPAPPPPAPAPPAPAPAPPPATPPGAPPAAVRVPAAALPRPARIGLALAGRRLSGAISPYAPACAGRIRLLVRARERGRWRTAALPGAIVPTAAGRFQWLLGPGQLRVSALLSSRCGGAVSAWVAVQPT